MLKISKLADYAVIIVSAMVNYHNDKANNNQSISATEIGTLTKLKLPTIRKVMKCLLKHHLLTSSRGAGGGYRLAQRPEDITLDKVVEAIDGPISLVNCTDPLKNCFHLEHCTLQTNWPLINQLVKRALASVNLLQMAKHQ